MRQVELGVRTFVGFTLMSKTIMTNWKRIQQLSNPIVSMLFFCIFKDQAVFELCSVAQALQGQ